jgi:hypothetical protein
MVRIFFWRENGFYRACAVHWDFETGGVMAFDFGAHDYPGDLVRYCEEYAEAAAKNQKEKMAK